MNKYQEAEKMAKIIIEKCRDNTEDLHWQLDELLLFVLRNEGYKNLVELFESSDRWYS